jgi:RNA-directed DNA polymerase
MPLGNLTSQFFANVYLNELDKFIKNKLRIKYYIRYVDDFVILDERREKLIDWKKEIDNFLKQELKIELHPDKSRIVLLSKGIDFVGFRNFYYYKLLRKRSIRNMKRKIDLFKHGLIEKDKFIASFQGWDAYAKWANTYKLRKNLINNSRQISHNNN